MGNYNGQVLYVLLFNSNGKLPLTDAGFSISNIPFTSNLVGLREYAGINNSTLETILLNNVPSTAGNRTIEPAFTPTTTCEFLVYQCPGKSSHFKFYQNVTVIN